MTSSADDGVPTLEVHMKHQSDEEKPLSDEELILTSPILYGFSLSDKIWCMYYCVVASTASVYSLLTVQ